MVSLQDRKSCFLWHDLWGSGVYSQLYPELYSFGRNDLVTLSVAVNTPTLHSLFHLPLSREAFAQLNLLTSVLQGLQLHHSNATWSYIWGSSSFSSHRAYKYLIGYRQIHLAFKWLWRSSCQNKRNFFFWLVLKDRLSTRALLRRRNMHLLHYNCVFCGLNVEEDLAHLLFHCPFSMACWSTLQLVLPNSDDPCFIVECFKLQLGLAIFYENYYHYVMGYLDGSK